MNSSTQIPSGPKWRRHLPSDERDLMRYTGFALYLATTAVIGTASIIHGLAPENVNFWRLILGGPAIAIAFMVLFLGNKLSDKAFYRAAICWLIPGIAVNGILLQITPATLAILLNLLVAVMFTGYFMKRRELILMMAGATAIALSPLFTEIPGNTANIGAWLTVYVPTMWVIALALHIQKTAIQRALGEVAEKAFTDPLTGLANLRAIRERANQMFAQDADQLYTVMLIDIDNFKSANTLHGHLGGDRALRCVADQLKRVAPPESIVARVGGDEFAVLTPITSRERLDEIAAMFSAAVRAASVEMRLPGVEIDASVGTAVYPEDGRALDTLMTAADKSMYEKKNQRKQNKPRLTVIDDNKQATEPVRWIDDEVKVVETRSAFREWLSHYTMYARCLAAGWIFGIAVIGLSLAMPDADDAHLVFALCALSAGVLLTTVMLLINANPLGSMHYIYDAISLGAIALIAALTGGIESPATVLVYLLVVFQGWFWGWREIVWRIAGPAVVLLAPLAYTNFDGSMQIELAAATIYAGISVSVILSISMYFNAIYLRQIENKAQRLASTDPLTGISNRRAFNKYVEQQLVAAQTSDRGELAIVMIDLDNFKDVNTVHGHRTGDVLLCDIAASLVAVAREEDCVARVGGDEFAAVLPGAGIDGARALAERFVEAVIDCTTAKHDGALAAVSASAGFALFPLHGDTLDELVRSADDALMTVKADAKGTARVSRLISAV